MEESPKCLGIGKKGSPSCSPCRADGRRVTVFAHSLSTKHSSQPVAALSSPSWPRPSALPAFCVLLFAVVTRCWPQADLSTSDVVWMLPLVTLLWLRDKVPTWLFFPALSPWDGDERENTELMPSSSCPQEATCNRYFARGKKSYVTLCDSSPPGGKLL